MEHNTDKHSPEKQHRYVPQFLGMMIIYLLLVYGWTLIWTPPGCTLSRPQIVLNLVLMYGCMVAVFFLCRYVVRAPWWLGAFAAVLMMAHPLIATDILSEQGTTPLMASLLYLYCLLRYRMFIIKRTAGEEKTNEKHYFQREMAYFTALLCFTGAMLLQIQHSLFLVVFLLELLYGQKGKKRYLRIFPFLIIGAFIYWLSPVQDHAIQSIFLTTISPLAFLLFPMPYGQATVAFLQAWPLVGWSIALIVMLFLGLLLTRLQHPGFHFGLLGAMVLRLYTWGTPIDLVTGEGANTLLLPLVLVNIAIAALCNRIIQHPKWQRAVIGLTTGWALVFFVLKVMRIYGVY